MDQQLYAQNPTNFTTGVRDDTSWGRVYDAANLQIDRAGTGYSNTSLTPPGTFNASYSFTADRPGGLAGGIFTYSIPSSTTIAVVDSFLGHQKALQFYDNANPGRCYASLPTSGTSGNISLWFSVTTALATFPIQVYSGGAGGTLRFGLKTSSDGNWYRCIDGVNYVTISVPYAANRWYFLQLDYIDTTIWINVDGVLVYGGAKSGAGLGAVDTWAIASETTVVATTFYVDALLCSWDAGWVAGSNAIDQGQVGVYNATYSFEDDTMFGDPAGWTDGSGASTYARVVPQVSTGAYGHRNVLQLDDQSGANTAYAYRTLGTNVIAGTVEGWCFSTNVANQFVVMVAYDGGTGGTLGFSLYIISSAFYVGSSGADPSILAAASNTWYHWRVQFDCDTDKVSVWINGMLRASGLTFDSVLPHVDTLSTYTAGASTGYQCYHDGYDLSWESPDYYPERSSFLRLNSTQSFPVAGDYSHRFSAWSLGVEYFPASWVPFMVVDPPEPPSWRQATVLSKVPTNDTVLYANVSYNFVQNLTDPVDSPTFTSGILELRYQDTTCLNYTAQIWNGSGQVGVNYTLALAQPNQYAYRTYAFNVSGYFIVSPWTPFFVEEIPVIPTNITNLCWANLTNLFDDDPIGFANDGWLRSDYELHIWGIKPNFKFENRLILNITSTGPYLPVFSVKITNISNVLVIWDGGKDHKFCTTWGIENYTADEIFTSGQTFSFNFFTRYQMVRANFTFLVSEIGTNVSNSFTINFPDTTNLKYFAGTPPFYGDAAWLINEACTIFYHLLVITPSPRINVGSSPTPLFQEYVWSAVTSPMDFIGWMSVSQEDYSLYLNMWTFSYIISFVSTGVSDGIVLWGTPADELQGNLFLDYLDLRWDLENSPNPNQIAPNTTITLPTAGIAAQNIYLNESGYIFSAGEFGIDLVMDVVIDGEQGSAPPDDLCCYRFSTSSQQVNIYGYYPYYVNYIALKDGIVVGNASYDVFYSAPNNDYPPDTIYINVTGIYNHPVYFSAYDALGIGIESDKFALYINGTRKNWGFVDIYGQNMNVTVMDFFNLTIYSQVVSTNLTEYNLLLGVYPLKIQNQMRADTLITLARNTGNYSEWILAGEEISYPLYGGTYNLSYINTELDTFVSVNLTVITTPLRYIINTSYYSVYISTFGPDLFGLGPDAVRLYVDSVRKSCPGPVEVLGADHNITILDYFNDTLYSDVVSLGNCTEFNIPIVYAWVNFQNNYNFTAYCRITKNDIILLNVLLQSNWTTQFRFTVGTYYISFYYQNGTHIHDEYTDDWIFTLDENDTQLVPFGYYSAYAPPLVTQGLGIIDFFIILLIAIAITTAIFIPKVTKQSNVKFLKQARIKKSTTKKGKGPQTKLVRDERAEMTIGGFWDVPEQKRS